MIIHNPFRKIQNIVKVAIKYPAHSFGHRFHIAQDYAHLYNQKGLLADEYLEYEFEHQSESFRNTFLGLNEQRYYLDLLNPQKYYILARNKYFAHKMMEKVGIQKAELYCYYNPEGVFCDNDETAHNLYGVFQILKAKNVQSCVIKATEGSHGDDVWVIKAIDYEGGDCMLHLYNNSVKKLSSILADKPLIFESQIHQTEQLAALNPTSVNTVRFMTTLYPDGEARIIATFIKIGRAGSCVDNAGAGGNVDACVDTDTGELRYAIRYDGEHNHPDINEHPDSHVPVNGLTIENWDNIKQQVLKYQQALPYVKAAGWDIAITDNGPVVIEVNDFWDRLGQLFLRRGWRMEIRDCYKAWLKTNKKYYFGRKNNLLRNKHLRQIFAHV